MATPKRDSKIEGQEISKTRAMKVDRWARVIMIIMFVIECTTILAFGLTHDEPINKKPGYGIHYLESVKQDF